MWGSTGVQNSNQNVQLNRSRNKMLEKKSVFTIAYDEVTHNTLLRPDTSSNGNMGSSDNVTNNIMNETSVVQESLVS